MKHIDFYIKIIVVVPFIGYDSKWPDQSKHRLKKLIQNANDSIVISHSADVSSYKKRCLTYQIQMLQINPVGKLVVQIVDC